MNMLDVYMPILTFFRRGRMRRFVRVMGIDNSTRVIDVGGTSFIWRLTECHPQVTLINMRVPEDVDPHHQIVVGSGRAIPFADDSFDLSFSNSVIEHVGSRIAKLEYAQELRRVSRQYWVQTPNRLFPVEPHFICLFLHWLPFSFQRRLIRHFSVWGLVRKPSQRDVDLALKDVDLLTERDLRDLFPDAEIIKERFFGLAKSLIAVKRS
jgi:Methyltransferase domain